MGNLNDKYEFAINNVCPRSFVDSIIHKLMTKKLAQRYSCF